MPSPKEFAAQVRQRNPNFSSKFPDDNALVDAWLQKYPQDAKLVQRDIEPAQAEGVSGGWGATAARVIPSVGGAVLGSGLGPVGTAVGGGIGAGVGEMIAEYLEGRDFKPKQIATQAALGAIPVPGVKAGKTMLQQMMGQGIKGAGLGVGATTATALADDELPSMKDLAVSAGTGAALGAGAQKFFGNVGNTPRPSSGVPRLDALNASREALNQPKPLQKAKDMVLTGQEKLSDTLIKPKRFLAEAAESQGIKLDDSNDPRAAMEIALGGAGGRAQQGQIDLDEITGAQPKWKVDKQVSPTMTARVKNPNARQQARATQDIMPKVKDWLDLMGFQKGYSTLEDKANIMATKGDMEGADALINKLTKGRALPEGYTKQTIAQDLQTLTTQWGPQVTAEVEKVGKEIMEFNRKTLDLAKDAGFISPSLHQELAGRGGHVPLARIIDTLDESIANLLKGKSAAHLGDLKSIKELWGSKRTTIDPVQASLIRRQILEIEMGRNKAATSFTDFFTKSNNPILSSLVYDTTGHKVKPGDDIIEAFVNGEKRSFGMPEDIARAMRLMHEKDAKSLASTMLGMASAVTMRFATAANPAFALTNPIRDIADKAVFSKEINSPLALVDYMKDWVTVLKDQITDPNNPMARKFREQGAAYSTKQRQMTGSGGNSWLDKRLAPLENLSNLLEETTKISTFKNLEKKGITGQEQTIRTRRLGGSPDFAVKGSESKSLNNILLFYNAQIQGIKRNFKGFKNMPPTRAIALLSSITGAELLRDEWNSQFTDPDGTPSADRITDSDRENYWTFITPKVETIDGTPRHTSIKISKGHALRVMANPISDLIESVRHGRRDLSQTGLTLLNQFLPGSFNLRTNKPLRSATMGAMASVNPAVKTVAEQLSNRSFYNDVPIVPRRLEGLPNEQQINDRTSTAAKVAGKITGGSPIRIDSAFRSMVPGSVGSLIGGDPTVGLTDIKRRFVGSEGDQVKREMEQSFYDELGKVRQTVQAFNKLKKENPAEAIKFQRENVDILKNRAQLELIARKLGEVRAMPKEQSEKLERVLLKQAQQLLGKQTPAETKLTKSTLDALYNNYKGESNASKTE